MSRLSRSLPAVVLVLAWSITFAGPSPARAAGSPLPRITFDPAKGTTFLVHGTYPKVPSPCRSPVQPLLHSRFAGVIEVGRDTDGTLFVIAQLSFEDYLKGIAEMPVTWPMEALKAQVVAARTYALSHLDPSDPIAARLGYQLCATDQCQVYRGLGVADGPYGGRWRRAVNATAGQALLYQGRPANTMYFSTSNGETHGNDEIFGGSPLPYLRPVIDRDDGASPLSHWNATVRLRDVGRFLSAAGDWSGGSVTSVRRSGSSVSVEGGTGSTTLDALDFRLDLNSWAHCLDPGRYPSGGLPLSVPSRWYSAHTSGGSVVLDGRGWGHGVGMSQWGARGKAVRGLGYGDILAAYYGGLRPRAFPEPTTLRIGIATGLNAVVVAPDGATDVRGRSLRGAGPWKITGGNRLRVTRADPPPAYIEAGSVRSAARVATGERRRSTVILPQTSVLHLVLSQGGHDVDLTHPRTFEAGSTRLGWTVPAVVSGTYRVQAVVSNGTDVVRTAGVRVHVDGVPLPQASPSLEPSPSTPQPTAQTPAPVATPASHGTDVGLYLLIATGILALATGVFSLLWLRRRLISRGPSPDEPFRPPGTR